MNKWSTKEADTCDECSWADELEAPSIFINKEIQSVIRKLCNTIEKEWQMFFKGTVDEADNVTVTGYYIPEQEVTDSTVTNKEYMDKEFIDTNNIVCSIHSHSDMGVFFSGVDDDMTNLSSQLNYHIVVNNKGDHKAVQKIKTPCNKVTFKNINMVLVKEPEEEVEVEGIEKIEKKKYTQLPAYYNNSGYAWEGWNQTKKKKKKTHAINEETANRYNMYEDDIYVGGGV